MTTSWQRAARITTGHDFSLDAVSLQKLKLRQNANGVVSCWNTIFPQHWPISC